MGNSAIYDRFLASNIHAVLITEHVYKDYKRAWKLMQKFKPDEMHVYPGLEYVTSENIDLVIFSRTDDIYSHHFKPFQYSYRDIIRFIKRHPGLYAFDTHPFTLGRTSLMKKMGTDFVKEVDAELGAVEASYTVFSDEKRYLDKPILRRFFSKTISRITVNEKLPLEFYPKHLRFLAAGSDAHQINEIGASLCVQMHKNDVFYSLIHNRCLDIAGLRQKEKLLQTVRECSTTLKEGWLKLRYKFSHRNDFRPPTLQDR